MSISCRKCSVVPRPPVQDTINIPKYYDKLASDYDSRFSNPQLDYMRTVENAVLQENLVDFRGLILDVGCGTGEQTLALAKDGFSVIGLDISAEMIRVAKKKSDEAGLLIPFIIASADALPFKENSISMLTSMFGAYSHIPEFDCAFSEMHRVLADGGKALFTIVNRWNLNWWLMHTFVGNRDWVRHALKNKDFVSDGLWTYYFSRRELVKKMRGAGFQRARVGSIMIFLYPHLRRIEKKVSLYQRISGRIENIVRWDFPFNSIGYYLLAVCTK